MRYHLECSSAVRICSATCASSVCNQPANVSLFQILIDSGPHTGGCASEAAHVTCINCKTASSLRSLQSIKGRLMPGLHMPVAVAATLQIVHCHDSQWRVTDQSMSTHVRGMFIHTILRSKLDTCIHKLSSTCLQLFTDNLSEEARSKWQESLRLHPWRHRQHGKEGAELLSQQTRYGSPMQTA